MWARMADCVHPLLFLLMHFIVGGPLHGEEYIQRDATMDGGDVSCLVTRYIPRVSKS